MKRFRCRCCGRRFRRNNRIKGNNQHYCNSQACQRKRKSEWAKQKYWNDESHRIKKLAYTSEHKARTSRSEYQRDYRENHPEYVKRCRDSQRKNYRKRVRKQVFENIVNLDALHGVNIRERGICVMYRVKEKNIVNLDALSLYDTELQSNISIKPQLVLLM